MEWGEDYRRGLLPYCRLHLTLSRPPGKGTLLSLPRQCGLASRLAIASQRVPLDHRRGEAVRGGLTGLPLEELCFWAGAGIGDVEVTMLAASPHFHRLRELVLYGDPIGEVGSPPSPEKPGCRSWGCASADQHLAATCLKAVRKARPRLKVFWPGG